MMCICQIFERELWTGSWCVPDHTAMFETCSAVGLGIFWPVQTTSSVARTYQNTRPAMDCHLKRLSHLRYCTVWKCQSVVSNWPWLSHSCRETGLWNGGQGNGTREKVKAGVSCTSPMSELMTTSYCNACNRSITLTNFQLTTWYLTPPANTVHIALFRAAILA